MVGPASMFHIACHQLDLKWTEPFVIIFPLLTIPYQYFLHLIRYAIARALWKRAAASRKTLKGIQVGIDKKTTTEWLNSKLLQNHDQGILRAIFVMQFSLRNKDTLHAKCHIQFALSVGRRSKLSTIYFGDVLHGPRKEAYFWILTNSANVTSCHCAPKELVCSFKRLHRSNRCW